MELSFCPTYCFNPFPSKGFPIDEENRLALDSKIYKCPERSFGS